jgi:hypothetical protein
MMPFWIIILHMVQLLFSLWSREQQSHKIGSGLGLTLPYSGHTLLGDIVQKLYMQRLYVSVWGYKIPWGVGCYSGVRWECRYKFPYPIGCYIDVSAPCVQD